MQRGRLSFLKQNTYHWGFLLSVAQLSNQYLHKRFPQWLAPGRGQEQPSVTDEITYESLPTHTLPPPRFLSRSKESKSPAKEEKG